MSDIGNKEVFAKNLRFYLKDEKQVDVCVKLGFKVSTMSDWLKAKKYPRIGKIEMLANYFGIAKSDLIEDKTSLPPGAFPPPHKKRIPILGRIAAGAPITAVENIEGYEWVDDESIDYGLVVKGNSMVPLIREDSAIYVAKDLPVENGDVVVALVDGLDGADATVKRYYKWGNQVILKPENPSYKEQEYSAKDVRIVGKVKEIRIKL